MDDRPRTAAVIATETYEIGDDEVWSGVHRRVFQSIDVQKFVVGIPEHLVEELSHGAIVVDHEDSSHRRNVDGARPGAPL
jgi:hypothetical protein